MKKLSVRASQLLLIFLILGIPCLMSVTERQQTEIVQKPFQEREWLFGGKQNVVMYSTQVPLEMDSVLSWHTFIGASANDYGNAIAVDGSGNIYVAGTSYATWGSPVNAHAGSSDAFIAKLDSGGTLVWNTFIGSSDNDYGNAVAVDGDGNVYVVGYSEDGSSYMKWGDAFALKLNSSGSLQWKTSMGSFDILDYGNAIALDGSGNVYVSGYSDATWGSPVAAFAGARDAFAAMLNTNGVLQWNTFMGSSLYNDIGRAIAVDGSGNVYVAGDSGNTWGTPVNAHAGPADNISDAFAAKLNSIGSLTWNTFMGGTDWDYGNAIAVDGSQKVYVGGESETTWDSPVNAFAGNRDAFAAKLDSDGTRDWHTFMGSSDVYYNIAATDCIYGLVADGSGNVYVGGEFWGTWGSPLSAYTGGGDALVAMLDSSGALSWHTFMGSSIADSAYGIAVDGIGNLHVAGYSNATWGSPVNAHAGGRDALVAKFGPSDPMPDIKANGSDTTITITQGEALSVNIELDAGGRYGEDADWWILMKTSDPKPNNWLYFDFPTKSWLLGRSVTLQRTLFDVGSKKVPKTSGLAAGTYTFYFAVDTVMNGVIDVGSAYYDKVKVIINP